LLVSALHCSKDIADAGEAQEMYGYTPCGLGPWLWHPFLHPLRDGQQKKQLRMSNAFSIMDVY
jgi:hypothetical protein